jgi:hypothetical protein
VVVGVVPAGTDKILVIGITHRNHHMHQLIRLKDILNHMIESQREVVIWEVVELELHHQ